MAEKVHPYTSVLAFSTNDSSYTDISDAASIIPPRASKGKSKTTHLISTAKTEEYIPGWRESGEIDCVAYFHKTQFAVLLGQYQSDTIYYYRVTFPVITGETTGSRIKAQGFITDIGFDELNVDSDDAIKVPFKIKLTGPLTFTAGS